MSERVTTARSERSSFIGGSDARVIMGTDETALLRVWQEKRGEAHPEDLSGNLVVQLGRVTEALNRDWYERNTGQTVDASSIGCGIRCCGGWERP
jgi:predicted phage-related endonuclease